MKLGTVDAPDEKASTAFWLRGLPRLCAFLLLAWVPYSQGDDSGASQLGASDTRLQFPKYPAPKYLSDAAVALLSKPIDMGRARQVPRSDEEWIGQRAAVHQHYLPLLQAMREKANAEFKQHALGGVQVYEITPAELPAGRRERIILHMHGGSYTQFDGELSALEALQFAVAAKYRVIAVDYRMPPEHPFPAAVNDCVAVYKALLTKYSAQNIAVSGSSSGGGLAAATLLAARDAGLELPAAAVFNSAWADLSKTGDSYFTNEGVDPVLPSYDGALAAAAELYAGGESLKHPLISPVYADYRAGFAPSLLISGSRDLLLSNTLRLHRVLRAAGQQAELLVFDAMWHGFNSDGNLEESQQAVQETVKFLRHQFAQASQGINARQASAQARQQ